MVRKFRLLLMVASISALAACHSGVKMDQGANGANGMNGMASNGDQSMSQTDPLNDPNSFLSTHRSIYFGFDSYSVDPQYQSLLQQHAQYLQSHPGRHVKIEGNTDDRGSSEYNLALGNKRAQAVQSALSSLGVSPSQMEAVSFGKERPVASGENEQAWAQNRRADLDYSGQ